MLCKVKSANAAWKDHLAKQKYLADAKKKEREKSEIEKEAREVAEKQHQEWNEKMSDCESHINALQLRLKNIDEDFTCKIQLLGDTRTKNEVFLT